MSDYSQYGIYAARSVLKKAPPLGAPPQKVLAFADRCTNFDSIFRNTRMRDYARNYLYYNGRQWITLDRILVPDGVRGYIFRDLEPFDHPQPVTNIIAPAADNEIARISKKQLQPKIVADAASVKIRRAASLATDVLKSSLKKDDWDQKRDEALRWLVICGTALLRSAWDQTILDTVTVANPDATQCPNCGSLFANPTIPRGMSNTYIHPGVLGTSEDSITVSNCPLCSTPFPLQPTNLSPDQAEGGRDALGRPLGMKIPRGNPSVIPISPFEAFPQNGGAGIKNYQFDRMARAWPVDIGWLESRYPEHCDQIKPEEPRMLVKTHPILGNWTLLGRYEYFLDADLYDNHVMAREVCIEPFVEIVTQESIDSAAAIGKPLPDGIRPGDRYINDGRYYLTAGNVVLEEGPLLITYDAPCSCDKCAASPEPVHPPQQKKLKRVLYSACGYKPRPDEFWAQGLPDDGISPQNRINARDAMWIEAFDAVGNPSIWLPSDVELRGPEMREDSGLKIFSYERSMTDPTFQPKVIQGAMPPTAAWQERDHMMEDIQNILHYQDIDKGQVPERMRTTSAMVLAGQNAATMRLPKEFGFSYMCQQIFKHRLQLLCAFRTEQDTYTVDAKGAKSTSIKYFRGADLAEQHNVEFDTEASVDNDIYTREAVQDTAKEQPGLYNLSDPVARRKYLEYAGIPEVNDSANAQIQAAQDAAIAFSESRKLHNPDPNVEDPQVWYEVYGQMWTGDESIQEALTLVQWNETIAPRLEGWENDLNELEAQDKAARAYYKNMNPQQIQQRYQEGMQAAEQATRQAQVAAQMAVKANLPAPPPPPINPPPDPVFAPRSLKQRIRQVWAKLLGVQPTLDTTTIQPPQDVQELENLLDYRATLEAYRRMFQLQQTASMMGAPQISAPGTQPQPQEPQQGAGNISNAGVQMPTGRIG